MLLSRIDRAFRRYHRTGDPLALGRVFDAAAPELYRLAWHLLGNRHAAEDLVQTTFLVAIQDARSFAGGRAMPWLCGILAHRALHHRRQMRSREGGVPAAAGVAAADPAATAEATELRESVAAAVRALPDPYRQVLLLHLLHELTPKEVAEALARPDATVRVQLHRGLDLLRKALPAGVAAFARAGAPPPIGLGVVREVVLAEAGRHGAAAAAAGVGITTLGGLLLMKKVLLGVAILLVLLGAWSLWPSFEPLSRPDAAGVTAAGATVATTAMPSDTGVASPTVREEVLPPASTERAALEVLVQWSDGTPAPNVTVRVRPVKSFTGPWFEAVGSENELHLRAERTDGDGIARFDTLWPGKAVASADRGGKVDIELTAGKPQRCTLDIPRGFDVRGRVVDLDDRPIADATVWLSVASTGIESEPVAQAGPDGKFTIRSAGHQQVITATAPGFGCVKFDWVSEERAREERILRLRPAPGVLTGSVVDDAGQPIPGARVLLGVTQADSSSGEHRSFIGEVVGQDVWPSRVLRTDAAGTFRAEGLPALPWPVCAGAPGLAPARQVVDIAADRETAVTLRLPRGATIRGRAVDAAGSPIAGAEIHASHAPQPVHEHIGLGIAMGFSPLWAVLNVQTDARGCFVFDHVMPGVVQLSAYTKDMVSPRGQLELVDAQVVEWNPVLAAPLQLHGVVVDEAGQPFLGWNVRCEPLDDRTKPHSAGQYPDGRFRTGIVPDVACRISVSPSYPLFGESRAIGEFRPGPDPIRIVIPRAAMPVNAVRGRVLRPDGSPATGSVRVSGTLGAVYADVQKDGTFRSPPVPGGRYRATFESESLGYHPIGECDVPEHRDGELGTFRVPEPGHLVVTIVDSRGAVKPDAWVLCRSLDDLRNTGSLTHREGHATGYLRPGRQLLTTREHEPLAAMEVDVRGGETTEVRFVVPDSVPFRLRVPAAASTHRGLRQFWRDDQGTTLRISGIESDEPGKDIDRSAPPGRYTLEVRDADGRSATTTFDLRATDPPMVVEMPLPAPK